MERVRRSEAGGFTLVELLVTLIVIAILAAISLPLFIRQREKVWAAQVQSSLKNAAQAAQSAGTESDDYSVLNDNEALLAENGFTPTEGVEIGISAPADGSSFCIAAVHEQLTFGRPWSVGSYSSEEGRPVDGSSDCVSGVLLVVGPGTDTETGTEPGGTDTETGTEPGGTDTETGTEPGGTEPGGTEPGGTEPGTGKKDKEKNKDDVKR